MLLQSIKSVIIRVIEIEQNIDNYASSIIIHHFETINLINSMKCISAAIERCWLNT